MPEIEPAIDVEVTATATDTPTADAPIEPAIESATDIETKLNNMSIQSIRKLAATKGANGKGTRAEIAARLKTIVTESDVLAAS